MSAHHHMYSINPDEPDMSYPAVYRDQTHTSGREEELEGFTGGTKKKEGNSMIHSMMPKHPLYLFIMPLVMTSLFLAVASMLQQHRDITWSVYTWAILTTTFHALFIFSSSYWLALMRTPAMKNIYWRDELNRVIYTSMIIWVILSIQIWWLYDYIGGSYNGDIINPIAERNFDWFMLTNILYALFFVVPSAIFFFKSTPVPTQ